MHIFFTKLALMCNESLPNLLINVHNEVYEYINIQQSEGSCSNQLLVYKELLNKKVNFLNLTLFKFESINDNCGEWVDVWVWLVGVVSRRWVWLVGVGGNYGCC